MKKKKFLNVLCTWVRPPSRRIRSKRGFTLRTRRTLVSGLGRPAVATAIVVHGMEERYTRLDLYKRFFIKKEKNKQSTDPKRKRTTFFFFNPTRFI